MLLSWSCSAAVVAANVYFLKLELKRFHLNQSVVFDAFDALAQNDLDIRADIIL